MLAARWLVLRAPADLGEAGQQIGKRDGWIVVVAVAIDRDDRDASVVEIGGIDGQS